MSFCNKFKWDFNGDLLEVFVILVLGCWLFLIRLLFDGLVIFVNIIGVCLLVVEVRVCVVGVVILIVNVVFLFMNFWFMVFKLF